MELLYDMLFVEKDIVMIGLILVIIALIGLIIYGVTQADRQGKKGTPLYKTTIEPLEPLNQLVLKSSPVFQTYETKQDKLFKKEFFIGKKIVINDNSYVISRVKKEVQAKGISLVYAYIIYFETYEQSELPRTLSVINNKHIETIVLNEEGIKIIGKKGNIRKKAWETCDFSNMNYKVTLLDMTDCFMNKDYEVTTHHFADEKDYYYLEEILIKYAKFV